METDTVYSSGSWAPARKLGAITNNWVLSNWILELALTW
jgi:hypothetical protein